MNRIELERTKRFLESKGYKVSKKMNESYNPNTLEELVREYAPKLQYGGETTASIWDDIVQEYGDEDLANDVIEALENEDVYESKKMNESEDSYPLRSDWEEERERILTHCRKRLKSGKVSPYKLMMNVGMSHVLNATEMHDIDTQLSKEFNIPLEDFRKQKMRESTDDFLSREMNESGGHAWMINHPGYDPIGAPAISDEDREKSRKAGEEREKAFIARRRKEEGAPEDYEYNGVLNKFIKMTPEGEKSFEIWNESIELNKNSDLASEGYRCVGNVNGYFVYRKIVNGKGSWLAKRQDDPDDKMFPISYQQALGYEEMPDRTQIEKLQKEMGDMLLPKNESETYKGHEIKDEKGHTVVYKDGKPVGHYDTHREAKDDIDQDYRDDLDEDQDYDEWDPFEGKKYRVSYLEAYGDDTTVRTDSPAEAIEAWFKYGQESPTYAFIDAKKKVDAVDLCKAATEELLTRLHAKYKCPYELNWLISEAKRKVEDGQAYFHEHGDYGDSIHPFGVG